MNECLADVDSSLLLVVLLSLLVCFDDDTLLVFVIRKTFCDSKKCGNVSVSLTAM